MKLDLESVNGKVVTNTPKWLYRAKGKFIKNLIKQAWIYHCNNTNDELPKNFPYIFTEVHARTYPIQIVKFIKHKLFNDTTNSVKFYKLNFNKLVKFMNTANVLRVENKSIIDENINTILNKTKIYRLITRRSNEQQD